MKHTDNILTMAFTSQLDFYHSFFNFLDIVVHDADKWLIRYTFVVFVQSLN